MKGLRGDPRFGPAVLKLAFLSGGRPAPAYREIYEGTLRDLGLREADVEEFLAKNRAAVEEACRAITARQAPETKGE